MTRGNDIKPEKAPPLTWICKKCGLLRSNKKTHKHGEEMKDDVQNVVV